ATWRTLAGSGSYETAANWGLGQVPGAGETAFFGTSNTVVLTITGADAEVGGWTLHPWASDYTIAIHVNFRVDGTGFTVNGGSLRVEVDQSLDFHNNSTAGSASIFNLLTLNFLEESNAGKATIVNESSDPNSGTGALAFSDNASAGSASITNVSG